MISKIATATGISWGSTVMVLIMLAFILYIMKSGSILKYRQMLF